MIATEERKGIMNTLSHGRIRAVLMVLAVLFIAGERVTAADRMVRIDPRSIEIGGEIGRRIDVTIDNNLLVLDADNDFLRPFRERNAAGGYIGLGKLIDAAVRFAVYRNSDDRVLALKRHLVRETIRLQENDGYIGLMKPESRMWALWDIHEMSYLVLGLTADHRFFGEKASLETAKKLADYMINRWKHENPAGPSSMGGISTYMATTSFENALLALYEQTGDARYLDFCVKDRKLPEWDVGIVVGRHGLVDGHAYSYLCRCLAQLELYRIQPDKRLLERTHDVIDFLTRRDGLVITGTCGYQECWHDNHQGFFKLGETCATAYLIRFLDNLLRLEGDSRYGDIMERAIYNALFAAQSPDGRRIRYYVPFEGERIYFDRDTYCCPCNYRRIIAELPGMVYYRCDNGLAVNLYTESSAMVELGGDLSLKVRQTTGYPARGKVVIHLDPTRTASFPVRLRIPRWCDEASISVNGESLTVRTAGGSFFTIERMWKAGDRIELDMPMAWKAVRGRKAQEGRVAVMRGPVLFCLNPERNEQVNPGEVHLLRIDTSSLAVPEYDQADTPFGMTCRVKFWNPNSYIGDPDISAVLTGFTDPGGRQTYFLVQDPKADNYADDELYTLEPGE